MAKKKKTSLRPILQTSNGTFYKIEEDDVPDVGVFSHLFEYENGRMSLGRDTKPRFAVPVVRDDNGLLHLDRDNVVWVDPEPTDPKERERLLDEYDDPKDLQRRVNELTPAKKETED